MAVSEQTLRCRVIDPAEAMVSRRRGTDRQPLIQKFKTFAFFLVLDVFFFHFIGSVAHALPETALRTTSGVGVGVATEDVPPSLVDLHLLLNDVQDVEREESSKSKGGVILTRRPSQKAPLEESDRRVDAVFLDGVKSLPTYPQNVKEVAVLGVATAVLGYMQATKSPDAANVKQPFKKALEAFLGVLTDLEVWNSVLPERFKGPIVAFTKTKKAFDKATNRRARRVASPPPWEGLLLLLSLPILVLVLASFVISLFIASVVAAAVAGAVVLTGLFAVTFGSVVLVVGLLITAVYWLLSSVYRIIAFKITRGGKEQGTGKKSPS